MIVVGIGHKSRQGKDEFANFLTTYLRMQTKGKRIMKLGFADQLKLVAHQLYGWAGVKEPDHYEKYPQDRVPIIEYLGYDVVQLWIKLGNHMREFDGNVWINALLKGAKADVLVLKDMRFPNEAKAVEEAGGTRVRVVRPDCDGLPSVSDNALNDYCGWTHEIDNSKDLQHLNFLAQEFGEKNVLGKL